MAGGKPEKSKGTDFVTVAKKIVIHSKADPLGDKFLKYLQHVLILKKTTTTGRSRSPWMELRTEGAFNAIMVALRKVFNCDQIQKLSSSISVSDSNQPRELILKSTDRVKDICNAALSTLSNAFALDYSVRAEAVKLGFTTSLQQFIAGITQDVTVIFKNAQLISRAVKCTANLSNDSHCREAVLKTGVAISILKVLELADEKIPLKSSELSETEDSFIDKSINTQLICSCVRAVRILASDSKCTSNGKDHLIKFGAPVAVINVLTWEAKLSSNEELVLDIIRALTLLSVKIRGAPSEVVQRLIYNPEVSKIRNLLRIFENSQPDGKLYTPVINCLINLSANEEISDCLGGLRIFHIILNKLDNLGEPHYYDLIRLLVALTKHSSFNQSHLTTSSLIGSTLKILKCSRFKEFHNWLLRVYENLYEVSLSKLIKCDLVNHLCDILREEMEECDYDSLRKKISSFDDGRCSVHQEGGTCPFAPVYRCSSPSYQKIQEDMKFAISISEDNVENFKQRNDCFSPCNSPAHSWSSGMSSPTYSEGTSPASYSSFSEDEGCFSNGSSSTSPVVKRYRSDSPDSDICSEKLESDGPSSAVSDADGDPDEQGPAMKKLKLEDGSSSSSFSDNGTTREHQIQPSKSLDALKASVKKIVAVLNILNKCTYINPFPESILQITPILLGIIVRGKVSVMQQRVEYQAAQTDDEFRDLSRRSFEVSYKIILQMSSIYNIFPEIIVSGIVPILHRLQEPISSNNSEKDEQIETVQRYCSNLITRMVGLENETAGWREGFIMRTLLVNNSSISNDKMDQMVLNIPLLYEKHPSTLRKFEMKAKSWTKILDMLVNSDETSYYRFEDCALSLCSICRVLGVKWKAFGAGRDVPLLFNVPSELLFEAGVVKIFSKDDANEFIQDETTVKLTLDDDTVLFVKKDLLVYASPVFSAMFNGHFVEAGEQKVHLPKVSRKAVCLLIDQIYMQSNASNLPVSTEPQNQYDLATIFELFSLADRFLLEEIYERALNTLITRYICPYSAPMIYAESVKLTSLQKSGNSMKMMGDSSLNLFIIEYILTASGVRMSERCNAIRKIFDAVMPEHVVQDLKALIEHHMYKSSG